MFKGMIFIEYGFEIGGYFFFGIEWNVFKVLIMKLVKGIWLYFCLFFRLKRLWKSWENGNFFKIGFKEKNILKCIVKCKENFLVVEI